MNINMTVIENKYLSAENERLKEQIEKLRSEREYLLAQLEAYAEPKDTVGYTPVNL